MKQIARGQYPRSSLFRGLSYKDGLAYWVIRPPAGVCRHYLADSQAAYIFRFMETRRGPTVWLAARMKALLTSAALSVMPPPRLHAGKGTGDMPMGCTQKRVFPIVPPLSEPGAS